MINVVISQLTNLSGAYVTAAKCMLKNGNVEAALMDFKKAAFLDPLNMESHVFIGFLIRNENPRGSMNEYFKAADVVQNMRSQHSYLVWSRYHPPMIMTNDLVPHEILRYVEQPILPPAICADIDKDVEAHTGLPMSSVKQMLQMSCPSL
jgi:hypothetical protein